MVIQNLLQKSVAKLKSNSCCYIVSLNRQTQQIILFEPVIQIARQLEIFFNIIMSAVKTLECKLSTKTLIKIE
jgi:hypothetical protein